MRDRRSTEVISLLLGATALLIMFLCLHEFAPAVDQKIHEAIGKELAKEALGLLGPGGQIVVITRDTEAFHQPALDILLGTLKREVARSKGTIASIHVVQLDPLRPVEVPSGDFFEIIRRAHAGQVIASLLGPPLLAEEQRTKLGAIKPKIVALCSGNIAETIDLRRLFSAGLLHAAVVSKQPSAQQIPRPAESFDQLYMSVTQANLASSPLPAGAAL